MPSRIEEGPLDADGKQKCNLSTDYKEVRNCLREQEKTKVLLYDLLKVKHKINLGDRWDWEELEKRGLVIN